MSEYAHIHAGLDPLGVVRLHDGRWRQEIELTLTNDPDARSGLADPVCQLDSSSARQLAARLLVLADQAEPRPGARR
jgi:hypothetical protein